MAKDEHLYDQVAGELGRGQIRRGLWTKALADSGYDEQRAKAAYIRMRVADIRSEAKRQDDFARRALRLQQQAQVESSKLARLGSIQRERDSLEPLRRRRRAIRLLGAAAGAVLVGVLLLAATMREKDSVGIGWVATILVVALLLGGMLGYVVAEVVRWFMPSQRHLHRQTESLQREEHRLTTTPVQRFFGSVLTIVIVAVVAVAYFVIKSNR